MVKSFSRIQRVLIIDRPTELIYSMEICLFYIIVFPFDDSVICNVTWLSELMVIINVNGYKEREMMGVKDNFLRKLFTNNLQINTHD